ncbi:hypothetical protein BU24DRAFT_213519 [Aaosphaeria arxii CBS 175.79]|uniref:Uncharacterized protein n=1 Tax=Aaosphaeria arxii CBS 175.79 TaxID=1450172 RepID=A0A6A5XPV2_9PLEO|nr:uncharacterized protein BU24DRAFT_213519 [Aaosphaeria arxii CBS 175.79]KAF2014374.1 hypothetical protein BU24DRAFT_213519 [Aaosphaeria arxii CBS 175.79]
MRIFSGYAPVSSDDDPNAPEKGIDWNSSSEIIPSNTRSFIAYLTILVISLSANVLLLLHRVPSNGTEDTGRTKYSGLTFDTYLPYRTQSEYWDRKSSNLTSANAAWDAIDTDAMAISLHDNFAKQVGLGPSTRFPWDTERSIYYLKGFHDLHCLKLVRKAIVTREYGNNSTITLSHLLHCLDGLRQDVICTADDTPMPALIAHHVGDGQLRRCRDWNKMAAWATRPDQHACYEFDDYRDATNTLELFAFCPKDSPYRPIMEAYFEYHGHKDPYEHRSEQV